MRLLAIQLQIQLSTIPNLCVEQSICSNADIFLFYVHWNSKTPPTISSSDSPSPETLPREGIAHLPLLHTLAMAPDRRADLKAAYFLGTELLPEESALAQQSPACADILDKHYNGIVAFLARRRRRRQPRHGAADPSQIPSSAEKID